MEIADSFGPFREREFAKEVEKFLPKFFKSARIITEPKLKDGSRPDFQLFFLDGTELLVEVKVITPATRHRLRSTTEQLARYKAATLATGNPSRNVRCVLIVPDSLSEENLNYLHGHGIDIVIDGPTLRAEGVRIGPFVSGKDDSGAKSSAAIGQSLAEKLDATTPGKSEWFAYQKLVGSILEYLFTPPLGVPIPEHANLTRTNRRDFILPNYNPDDYWSYMRSTYDAHYIVVDAKNWVRKVEKGEVLQLANYLSPVGAGLFGMIICRSGEANSARITRREQWGYHHKMILVLTDDDVKQMITLRVSGGKPAELIRQQIEDFRLGF